MRNVSRETFLFFISYAIINTVIEPKAERREK